MSIDIDRGEGRLTFERVYYIARFIDHTGTARPVFARAVIDRDGELHITGVEGPKRNGDCWGSCGQIDMGWRDRPQDWTTKGADFTDAQLTEFMAIWDRWHLNHMRAGCEHQRAEGWGDRPIDPSKPTRSYGKHFEGQKSDSWNLLGWVRPDEHPEGLLGVPCPTCGYKYGTSWLREELPAEVIAKLASFPASSLEPAWV